MYIPFHRTGDIVTVITIYLRLPFIYGDPAYLLRLLAHRNNYAHAHSSLRRKDLTTAARYRLRAFIKILLHLGVLDVYLRPTKSGRFCIEAVGPPPDGVDHETEIRIEERQVERFPHSQKTMIYIAYRILAVLYEPVRMSQND